MKQDSISCETEEELKDLCICKVKTDGCCKKDATMMDIPKENSNNT